MTSGRGAICFACRFRRGDKCDAFPEGIPKSIIFGGFDHRRPFGGEQEADGVPILFELEPALEDRLKAYEAVVLDAPQREPMDEAERRRRAERFVWREDDIRWIVPPGSNRRDETPGPAEGEVRRITLKRRLKGFFDQRREARPSLVNDLETLIQLRKSGGLTEAEFKAAKKKLLE